MGARVDAIIIGAGHNGLVAAFDLARAGLKPLLLERRDIVGGCAVTEEFWPGFRNSTASYTVSLLRPDIIADMRLHSRGYRVVERPVSNFLPLEDGRALTLGGSLQRTQAEFARFSARDAERLPDYERRLGVVADVLRDLAGRIPPAGHEGALGLFGAALKLGAALRLDLEARQDLLDLLTRPAREVLEGWFESAPVQAAFGFDSCVGHFAGPSTPGSAYVLLHHVFGEVNGRRGAWGHAVGGMGAITRAMAEAATEAGATIRLEAPVAEVLTHAGRVEGVRLEDGETIECPLVLANVGPALLFRKLLPRHALPPPFAARMARYRTGSGSIRMNVALAGLPRFTARPEPGEHLQSGIVIAPSLDYMDRAHRDALDHGWSREPIVEMLIPSTVDDSLAPDGAHVASLFCQQFAPRLAHGDWTAADEEAAADTVFATIERHAPGFRQLVLGRQILSPTGLERRFGLVDGDIFHGRMSLDQLWAARPILGMGNHRTPIAGLYLCGAGSHPGGGVSGAPGRNAARAVLADRGLAARLGLPAGRASNRIGT
ncbi:MAG: phytoene desaturase family protein [Sphingomonadaceae bacterium]